MSVTSLVNEAIDAQIAVNVMGWEDDVECPPEYTPFWIEHGENVMAQREWEPSQDIAQAWMVLEKFPQPRFRVRLTTTICGEWWCEIEIRGGTGYAAAGRAAATPTMAICLAALAVMEKE